MTKQNEKPGFNNQARKTGKGKIFNSFVPRSSNESLPATAEEMQIIRQQNTPTNEGR
jgi:hypothetical protein